MDEVKTTFRVPECNIDTLTEKIAKLAKRATKLGLTPPSIVTESTEDVQLVVLKGCDGSSQREVKEFDPEKHIKVGFRRYFNIRLEGQAPTLPGHKLVAVVEHGNTEVGNILRVAPGMDGKCPNTFRQAGPWCDHCKTSRRRLETFVLLREVDQVILQVGRNCLADFCRDAEAAAGLCSYAEIFESIRGFCEGSEDSDFFGMGGRGVKRAEISAVLSMTARIIRHCGWKSRTQAREDMGVATADIIGDIFFNPKFFESRNDDSPAYRALKEAARSVEEQDVKLAEDALSWIRAKRGEAESLNDYLYNLVVVATEETVHQKHFGILCSLVATYQREMGLIAERQRQAKIGASSEFFGQEGTRGRWNATYMGSKAMEGRSFSYYQTETVRYLHRFAVNDKDIACWWTGSEMNFEIGDEVIIVGSVKKHEEYRNTKQTTMTRCDVYGKDDWGTCPNCKQTVIPNDKGKNCPHCKKRGLKMNDDCFLAKPAPKAEAMAS